MAVGAERRRENTPHEELMAGNLGRVVPVRIAEYDDAAKSGEGTLRGRLGTTFVTDYDQNAPQREEAPEAPREGRRPNLTFVTDYDEAAPREGEAPPQESAPEAAGEGKRVVRGRLGTTFVTDYDQNAPKERGGAPPVERLPEDIEPGERARERQAEGAGTKKASGGRGEKAFDVLDEEAKSAPSGRRAGRKARDDEGDILF